MATVKQVVSACVHFKLIYCPAEVVATKINAVARGKLERKKNADAIEQARQVTIYENHCICRCVAVFFSVPLICLFVDLLACSSFYVELFLRRCIVYRCLWLILRLCRENAKQQLEEKKRIESAVLIQKFVL